MELGTWTIAEWLAFLFCLTGVLAFYGFWAAVIVLDWLGYLPPLEDDPPTLSE